MNIKKYYGVRGDYLKEHKHYFTDKQLQKEVDFLIDVLNLKKKDTILDLCCGHGRHTIELKKRGFDIDGLDFSHHLLRIAKNSAKRENLQIDFYKQDVHSINFKKKYNKVFLFFSEFGLFNAAKALRSVTKILKNNGLFLLDCDNVFRLVQYLIEHPKSKYKFDFVNMTLKEKGKDKQDVCYYSIPELKALFNNSRLKITSIFGSYEKDNLGIHSKRIIIVGKKV